MWKYVSRRIRDTFEKSANYFDIRSTTGLTNTPNNDFNSEKKTSSPSKWCSRRRCWNLNDENSNTNSKRWNFEHLNCTWLGAITWSSGLVLGWYASQLIHLKQKYKRKEIINKPILYKFFCSFKPYINCTSNKNYPFHNAPHFKETVSTFTPTIHLIINDQNKIKDRQRVQSGSSSGTSSSDDLGDVLNSIENRLGLSAIENGQHHDGLNLLRSAANRNHAPAMYNLGLCYELGLGVKPDEKMAMELYRSAAALEHPGALYNLSIYYGQGRGGLLRDTDTATRLLRIAAMKGQEDAINALKALNISPTEEKNPDPENWSYSYIPYTQTENIVPSHSSLFVENVNPFISQKFHTSPTVY